MNWGWGVRKRGTVNQLANWTEVGECFWNSWSGDDCVQELDKSPLTPWEVCHGNHHIVSDNLHQLGHEANKEYGE